MDHPNGNDIREKPIAFFDSGVGGLTVLAAAARLLPREDFIYFGDTANAPYGSKTKDEVRTLSVRVADMLCRRGCKALVLACNTATSAAVDVLRQVLPIPVIGMEPAVKPALERGGKVLVMATPLTLREEKFRSLCDRCGADYVNVAVLPCPGLVEMVERGQTGGPEIVRKLAELFSEVDIAGVTTVVLGCTHYLYLREALAKILPPGVEFVDGNLGTVRQLERVLDREGLLRASQSPGGRIELLTSGGGPTLRLFRELYEIAYKKTEGLE